jgi:hypothetical protein
MFSITSYNVHVGAGITTDPTKPPQEHSPWPALIIVGGIIALIGYTTYMQATGKLPIYPPTYGYGYGPGYYGPPVYLR